MAQDLNNWKVLAANNNVAPPDGWPEATMQYSEVNDTGREGMAVLARYYKDINGSLSAGGIVNAYTVTLNATTYLAYFTGMYIVCTIPITNTGNVTLNVNSINVQAVLNTDGTQLDAGTLTVGGIYEFRYDGTQFQLMGAGVSADLTLNSLNLTSTDPVDLTDADNTLNVGVTTGAHIAFDGQQIQGKGSVTTANALSINKLGGDVIIGPQGVTGDVDLFGGTGGTKSLSTITDGITIFASAITGTLTLQEYRLSDATLIGDVVYDETVTPDNITFRTAGPATEMRFTVGSTLFMSYNQPASSWSIQNVTNMTVSSGTAKFSVNSTLQDYEINTTGQNLLFLGLPTTNPGGTNNVWRDSGTLKIT